MSDGIHFVHARPGLRERICDVEDGLTFDELLARSEKIVERSASQWRLSVLFELERLWDRADAIHRDPCDIRTSLPKLLELARAVADEALLLAFPRIRAAADDLAISVRKLAAAFAYRADELPLIADLAQSIEALEEALGAGVRH